jgi:hypothetical protein
MKKDIIFVSIASYRDPELLPTLQDCISKAEKPENLRFCIAWQHSTDDEWDTLGEQVIDDRFTIIDIDYKTSNGVCWARNLIQNHYDGEEYYLQLDSHHRFIDNWDKELKDSLNYLKVKGYDKPIISSYAPSYNPETDPEGRSNQIWGLMLDRFLPEGPSFLSPDVLSDNGTLPEPVPGRFLSAHFIFTLGEFCVDVKYDPQMYFHGEETSLAVRAFTHGYDIFIPNKIFVWHEYTRKDKSKHWDDDPEWDVKNKFSYFRFRSLFGIGGECSPCSRNAMKDYWFGDKRTVQDYELYAGIKFSTQQIHKKTLERLHPPISTNYHEFESNLLTHVKTCIDVYKGSLPEEDYDFWVVAILDENGNDIFRKDADESELKMLLSQDKGDQFVHIWREYQSNVRAYKSRIWPHSKSKGWSDPIEQIIPHE